MTEEQHTIRDSAGNTHTVIVRKDARLKKYSRWQHQRDGTILLRVPSRVPKSYLKAVLEHVAKSIEKQQKKRTRRASSSDAALDARAKLINKTYFGGKIEWEVIKWVGNMEKRLGSCTNGGTTDGHIRISERIRDWPEYVVDYVIAHELAHRVYSDHSRQFWDFLTAAYPLTERARGFIEGHGFARGDAFTEED